MEATATKSTYKCCDYFEEALDPNIRRAFLGYCKAHGFQPSRRLSLTPEPGDEPRVTRELGEEDLDRDRSMEHRVEAAVDLGHPARTDPRFNPVALTQHGIAHARSFTP